jgi:uncharacterized membrane protein YdfJ with MMPL/SSD domain
VIPAAEHGTTLRVYVGGETATNADFANHQAVRTGQATTGRVIIAAATIMTLVFSAFILSGQQAIGEIGIGLAAAVLLDDVLLRTLLVPAIMHLSGRANWWLPGWLDGPLESLYRRERSRRLAHRNTTQGTMSHRMFP